MYGALAIAASGLSNQQKRLDTIADNVANSNTNGFKASRLEFKDAMYTTGITPAATPRTPDGNLQHGHGVLVSTIVRDFSTGSMLATGNELDFVIEGNGFFALEDSSGRTVYTRGGNFYSGASEDGRYLVNSAGSYVLDDTGSRIKIPDGTQNIELDLDGVISFKGGTEEYSTKLGIYTFTNLAGLAAAGGGVYVETEISGAPIEATEAKTVQGMLESSNVNLATEMTRLIRSQRAFSLASRALTTADEMEGIANNLRR